MGVILHKNLQLTSSHLKRKKLVFQMFHSQFFSHGLFSGKEQQETQLYGVSFDICSPVTILWLLGRM